MRVVVITGSSRGIGFGVAHELLRRGHRVVVSGASQASTERATSKLCALHDPSRVHGHACDVRHASELARLWDAAVARFGQVDIWFNNAGVANRFGHLAEASPDEIDQVLSVDLAGIIHGCRVAIRGMRTQPGGGVIYNMEGFGSTDEMTPGLTLYGTAKRGLAYFTRSLAKELEGTNVKVAALSPGLVATDLLLEQGTTMSPEEWARTKRVFNILAEPVEVVAPFLAEAMLANQKNGARVAWLTRLRALYAFATAPRRMRRELVK